MISPEINEYQLFMRMLIECMKNPASPEVPEEAGSGIGQSY